MSSVTRQYEPAKPYTKFVNIISPCYDDSTDSGTTRLIPFTCDNGVIDIAITDSGVQNYIDNANGWDSYLGKKVKLMGGESLGQSLGPNMLTWLRNLIQNWYFEGSYTGPITIKVAPVMTKVQACQGQWSTVPLPRSPVVYDTNVNPGSDSYIVSGTPENNYYTSWIFKSPLTVEFQDGGLPYYITLKSFYGEY